MSDEPKKETKKRINLITMNAQFILDGPNNAFAVIPIAEFTEMQRKAKIADKINEETQFPLEVVEMNLLNGFSLIKAWRLYLNLTQKAIAQKLGISQGAFSQIEKSSSNHWDTIVKVAEAMGIQPEQLTSD